MVWDCHWHLGGAESGDDVLRALDAAGVDRVCLFADYAGESSEAQNASIDRIAGIAAVDSERIFGLAWIEPTLANAADDVERAIADKGLRGVKMIPHHWEPCSEAIFPVYERIERLGVPLMMHSGILFGFEDSSRFCRPVLYEGLIHFPKLRFSLAHIGWPWTDECLAVAGRFRAAVRKGDGEMQMFIDMAPGAPAPWRVDAIRKAIAYLGPERLMYGSDAAPYCPEYSAEILAAERRILQQEIGLGADAMEQIMWRTCAAMFGV